MRRLLIALALAATACTTPPASAPDASTGAKSSDDAGALPNRAAKPPSESGGEDDGGSSTPEPDASQKYEVVVGGDACETDADCVKAECCHPKSCVAVANEPSCGDVSCTLDCQAGTMDCFGGCSCQDGKCAARLWMGPADG